MKRETHLKVLLFSADDRHQAEIAEGWKEAVKSRLGSHSFDLLHYNCMETTDIIVILDILDRIRVGVFGVVTIVPHCPTWSRARHAEAEGQKPLRSRSCPLGLPALSLSEQRKVNQANECLELGVWLLVPALPALQSRPETPTGFRELLHPGWPQLDLIGDTLQYLGPLPKDCPCAIDGRPFRRQQVLVFRFTNFGRTFLAHILDGILQETLRP